MLRLNLVLLMAVLVSSLYLVGVQYESRRLYTDLDKARAVAHRLDADNERLQVEKRAQATPLRVEQLAKDKLQMRTVTPAITQYVTYRAEAPVVASLGNSGTGSGRPAAAGRIP